MFMIFSFVSLQFFAFSLLTIAAVGVRPVKELIISNPDWQTEAFQLRNAYIYIYCILLFTYTFVIYNTYPIYICIMYAIVILVLWSVVPDCRLEFLRQHYDIKESVFGLAIHWFVSISVVCPIASQSFLLWFVVRFWLCCVYFIMFTMQGDKGAKRVLSIQLRGVRISKFWRDAASITVSRPSHSFQTWPDCNLDEDLVKALKNIKRHRLRLDSGK